MFQQASEPRLPPELERVIFELVAYTQPLAVPGLMLVAWRVKRWVEPLRYRVVIISQGWSALHGVQGYPHNDHNALSRILSLPPSILRDSVRNLCISSLDPGALLAVCSSVENLWGGLENWRLDLMSALPLKRLHCHLAPLFDPHPIDFTHRLFSHITHLELFDGPIDVPLAILSDLACIPHLTHLAFNEEPFVSFFPDILRNCNTLQVLILVGTFAAESWEVSEELARESRFVWMACSEPIKDWHMGALTGVDYWSRAEDFIAKRRSGRVDSLQYYIEGDESTSLP